MFELLIKITNDLPYYPNSGPGTKYLLQGDETLGIFGTVPESEIGLFSSILDDVGVTGVNRLFNPDIRNEWLKIFYNGRVIYLPMFQTAMVSYSQLEAANMTYDFLKAGTPDTPVTLPSGKSMWKMGPLYTTEKDKDVLYPRLVDGKRNSATMANDEAFLADSEFYQMVMSIFDPALPSHLNVKADPALLAKFTGTSIPTAHIAEMANATTAMKTGMSKTHGAWGKAGVSGPSALELWFCALQLISAEDKKNMAISVKDIESWSDAVNSRPVGWTVADSLMPPFNFRAPHDQSVIVPKVSSNGLRGIPMKVRGPTTDAHEYGVIGFIPPILTAPRSLNDPIQETRQRASSPGMISVQPENVWLGSALKGCSGWVNNGVVYTPYGMGGTEGRFEVPYEGEYPDGMAIFNSVTKSRTRGPQTSGPGGLTWYSGVRIGSNFYCGNGYTAGTQRKQWWRQPVSGTGVVSSLTDNPLSVRVSTIVCSMGNGTKMFTTGGTTLSVPLAETAVYDIATNTWAVMASIPGGLHLAAAAEFNNKIYVLGGYVGNPISGPTPASGVRVYDIATNTWTMPLTSPFGFKATGQAFVKDGLIIAVGGIDSFTVSTMYAMIYDPVNNTVRYKALGLKPRYLGMADIQADGMLWIGSGDDPNRPRNGDNNHPVATVAKYDPAKIIAI